MICESTTSKMFSEGQYIRKTVIVFPLQLQRLVESMPNHIEVLWWLVVAQHLTNTIYVAISSIFFSSRICSYYFQKTLYFSLYNSTNQDIKWEMTRFWNLESKPSAWRALTDTAYFYLNSLFPLTLFPA